LRTRGRRSYQGSRTFPSKQTIGGFRVEKGVRSSASQTDLTRINRVELRIRSNY
jgi:hypothetical protein